jgi:hypothetical protein
MKRYFSLVALLGLWAGGVWAQCSGFTRAGTCTSNTCCGAVGGSNNPLCVWEYEEICGGALKKLECRRTCEKRKRNSNKKTIFSFFLFFFSLPNF